MERGRNEGKGKKGVIDMKREEKGKGIRNKKSGRKEK